MIVVFAEDERPFESVTVSRATNPRYWGLIKAFEEPHSDTVFDAEFSRVGELLWRLRDLATTVEVRSISITSVASADAAGAPERTGVVHVSLVLFAYAQQSPAVATAGEAP